MFFFYEKDKNQDKVILFIFFFNICFHMFKYKTLVYASGKHVCEMFTPLYPTFI